MNWSALSLAEQLGNVGSDFERALAWKEKKQPALAEKAVTRTLEQLDWTLADDKHAGPARREIARLRAEVCQELFTDSISQVSSKELQRYFLQFATLARTARVDLLH